MKKRLESEIEIAMEMINMSGYDLEVDTAAYGQYGRWAGLCPYVQY